MAARSQQGIFSDVRIPEDQLVGQENQGWVYAKFLLSNKRTEIAAGQYQSASRRDEKARKTDRFVRRSVVHGATSQVGK